MSNDNTKVTGNAVITADGNAYLASFKSKSREGLAKMIRDYSQDTSATVGDIENVNAKFQDLHAMILQDEADIKQLLTEAHDNSVSINELFSGKMSNKLNIQSKLFQPIEVDTPDPDPSAGNDNYRIIPDAFNNIKMWHTGQTVNLAPLNDDGHVWYLKIQRVTWPIIILPYNPSSDPVRVDSINIPLGEQKDAIVVKAVGENAQLQMTFNLPPQDVGMFQLLKLF